MIWIVLTWTLIIGTIYAEISTENVSNLSNINDVDAIKERCDKKGGPGTYDKIKKAAEDTKECVVNLIDLDQINDEVEEAKKTGSMDEVFGKYCNKRPDFFACIRKTTDIAELCLEEKEKDALNFTINIMEKIGDFICYRDGERIAMFIAEGGVECLRSRAQAIKDCINETLKIDTSDLDLNSIQDVSITKEKCSDLSKIQKCIVEDLEKKCEDSTPANIVDALLKFLKKVGCKAESKQKRSTPVRQLKDGSMNQIVENLKKACNENGGPDAFNKLEISLNSTKSCLSGKILLLQTPKSDVKKAIIKCSEEPLSALANCLPSQSSYYPTLLKETAISLVDFVYDHQEIFVINPNNLEMYECFRTLKSPEVQKEMFKCFEDSNIYGSNAEYLIPPKDEYCKTSAKMTDCTSTLIKSKCIADVKINKLISDFVKIIKKPCEM